MKPEIHRILCPTDFSASADYAFEYALAIAKRHGATVEVLHVAESSAYAEDPVNDSGERYDDKLRNRLQTMVKSKGDVDIDVAVNVLDGIDYVEIVNRATAWSADLIVLGTHGRTGMKHLLIGSVAERVVRTAPQPVLTIRHPDHVILQDGSEKH